MLFSSIASFVLTGVTGRPSQHAGISDRLQPTVESARARAHPIFRAINNAGRQWGSAMNHNGFSFFPAIIPAGTVMYHGSRSEEAPKTFEWLAFEIEHAEGFAIDVDFVPPRDPKKGDEDKAKGKDMSAAQKILRRSNNTEDDGKWRNKPGYVQTHQATKDLHVLYIDGMSAGKTNMGTMDAELYVLYGKKNEHFEDGEFTRAKVICDLLQEWGYDGYVRMEVGFEYVHCDFSKDLQLISSLAVYSRKGVVSDSSMVFFQWTRAVAEDYDGIGSDRLKIDYSSVISGLFYPLNITTMDPERPDLMRLATAGMHDLQKLKTEVELMARQPRRFTADWQAVTDAIVRRWANRLAFMTSDDISEAYLVDEFEAASRTYISAPEPKDSKAPLDPKHLEEAVSRCIAHHILPATFQKPQWSREDELIAAALEVVMSDICTVILESYNALRAAVEKDVSQGSDASALHVSKVVEKAHQDVKNLGAALGWSQWKQVRRCPPGELMFTVMWPFGNDEDYYNPGCQPIEKINSGRDNYFRSHFPGGHGPGKLPGRND